MSARLDKCLWVVRAFKTRSMATRACRAGGFTLVELMMGLTVLTAILAGCFNLLSQALLASERAQDYDFVSQLLQNEMESLRTLQWRQLDLLSNSDRYSRVDTRRRRVDPWHQCGVSGVAIEGCCDFEWYDHAPSGWNVESSARGYFD